MTEKDKELIARARAMHWSEWSKVADMAGEAESDEARVILNGIAVAGYHREEAKAGMI